MIVNVMEPHGQVAKSMGVGMGVAGGVGVGVAVVVGMGFSLAITLQVSSKRFDSLAHS
jgi:hypothetical protein